MRIFIKLILLVVIVGFALINYRIFSFDNGFSETSLENKSVTEVLKTAAGIKKVQYYKNILKKGTYKVYIVSNEASYLLDATQDDIDAFSVLGIFSDKLKPEKVKPIPFYVEIIIGIVVICIPFGKRKKREAKET